MVAKTGRLMQRSASPTPMTSRVDPPAGCASAGVSGSEGLKPRSPTGVWSGRFSIERLFQAHASPIEEFCLARHGNLLPLFYAGKDLLQPVPNPADLHGTAPRHIVIDDEDLRH